MLNLLHQEILTRRAKASFVIVLIGTVLLTVMSLAAAVSRCRERVVVYPAGEVLWLVDVNRADAGTLEMLPEVGPTLAGRIVAERESGGWFTGSADLERVRGIGPVTSARLSAYVSFDDEE